MTEANGKVTLALVKQSIDHLIKTENDHYTDLRSIMANQEGCIRALELDNTKHGENIKTIMSDIGILHDDVDKVDAKTNNWSLLNSIGAIIAAILAGVGLKQ